jgi:putative transcriptional regulator
MRRLLLPVGSGMICVRLMHLRRLLAASFLAATLPPAELPSLAQPAEHASLRGQLLIASPAMSDPRFDQAVILLVRHDRKGALGIVINRPLEDRSLASLLKAMGENDATVEGTVRIFAGGPVQPGVGFVVHSADYRRPDTMEIDGHLAVTSSREILHDIGNKTGPAKSLVAFGYAGWAPGQLEGELDHRFWFTTPADSRLVFDQDRGAVWDEAMKRRTQDL